MITRRSLLQSALAFPAFAQGPAWELTAATGEKLPHPLSNSRDAMVLIPAGKFTMGERESEHQVELDAFYMAKYLVTNAEYKAFVDTTGHPARLRHWRNGTYPEGKANHPVLWVSYNDAQRYCAWAGVSLPTEAQWEKAARGPKAYLYPWGNDRNPAHLNFNGLCAKKYGLEISPNGMVTGWKAFTETAPYRELVQNGGYTTPVGAFPSGKSAYGCYDMAGNAWQWTTDWYAADYYKLPGADRNPHGPDEAHAEIVDRGAEHGKCKVIRGGSWYAHLISARSVNREELRRPEGGYHSVGFRIVAG